MLAQTETTNIIETLISSALAAEAQERQSEKEQQQAQANELYRLIQEALGGTWTALEPYRRQGKLEVDRYRVTLHIPFRPILARLEPFYACAQSNPLTILLSIHEEPWQYSRSVRETTGIDNLSAFLKARREAYPEWLEKALRPGQEKLRSFGYDKSARNPAEADSALSELIELAPEREAEWQALRAQWETTRLETQARWEEQRRQEAQKKQEREAARQRQEAAGASYEQAYREWLLRYHTTLKANAGRLAALQETFDQPYVLYLLFYALVAEDEDGREISTQEDWVQGPFANEGGFWSALRKGQVERMHFFHPVAAQGPLTVHPSDRDSAYARKVRIPEAQDWLWVALDVDPSQAIQEASFAALPPKPEIPDGLDEYDARQIAERIQDEAPQ